MKTLNQIFFFGQTFGQGTTADANSKLSNVVLYSTFYTFA